MPYCTQADVLPLKGDVALPSTVQVQDFIVRANNDIDAALSERYVVPIVGGTAQTTAVLLAINADLATGRLIMSLTVASQDEVLNEYGRSLVSRAIEGDAATGTLGLRALREGAFILPGATLKTGVTSASQFSIRIKSPTPDGTSDKSYHDYFFDYFGFS